MVPCMRCVQAPILVEQGLLRVMECALWADTSFLSGLGVMDYSLLVGRLKLMIKASFRAQHQSMLVAAAAARIRQTHAHTLGKPVDVPMLTNTVYAWIVAALQYVSSWSPSIRPG